MSGFVAIGRATVDAFAGAGATVVTKGLTVSGRRRTAEGKWTNLTVIPTDGLIF